CRCGEQDAQTAAGRGREILFGPRSLLGLQRIQRRAEFLSERLGRRCMRLDELAGLWRCFDVALKLLFELCKVALAERFQLSRIKYFFGTAHGLSPSTACGSMVDTARPRNGSRQLRGRVSSRAWPVGWRWIVIPWFGFRSLEPLQCGA